MKLIGITGGIGSGKTTVTDALRSFSAVVIDADEISRDVSRPGQPVYLDAIARWGDKILNPDRTWDRQAIARIVFNDERERRWLESVAHPRIVQEVNKLIREHSDEKVIFISAALLYESGNILPLVSEVWLCHAPEDVVVRRVSCRDNVDEESVKRRMRAQLPFEEKKDRADRLIDTNRPLDELIRQVRKLWLRETADA